MKFNLSFGLLSSLGGLGCVVLLVAAYLLQYWYQLTPCPLCLLQRYTLWSIVLVFGFGVLHHSKKGWKIFYTGLIIFQSIIGILLASRQIWLQHLPPDQVPACTAGLERLLSYYSIFETLGIVITGSGECGVVDHTILGLSLAGWSLVSFIVIMGFAVMMLLLQKKRRI